MFRRTAFALAAAVALLAVTAGAAPEASYGKIELIRDTWGIPHVFSDTDAGAFYGLGYATAEERGFQMHYSLRIIQGRLAEVVGDVRKTGRNDTAVHNDRKMRTFGFARAARAAAESLDAETRVLLEAYCHGVNDWFAANQDKLHPLFRKLGMTPEPWTPADCILSWWHLAQFFATDGTRDLISWRNETGRGPRGRGGMTPPRPTALWRDESAAVVQRQDVSQDWIGQIEAFLERYGPWGKPEADPGPAGPKFSHAWVVDGTRTTTGSAVLVSDPQTPVRNPAIWIEFHVRGKTFNARGVGVPGSPGLLIGFNEHVAWGATALGADQADLFRLKTDADHPDQYFFDGQWRKMAVRRETIKVKGGPEAQLTVRETHFGPIVTPFAYATRGDPEVALRRVPICEPRHETITALIKMIRARSAEQMHQALADWRFPSANLLFGDQAGHIGYTIAGALPIRSKLHASQGRSATDGTSSSYEWQGVIPHNLLPHVINPRRGWLASGNHSPVGSFYRIPLGVSTGSMGHSVRSWRLYERLGAKDKFQPRDVLDVHFDTVNPARRDLVRLGYHLRDVLKAELSPETQRALKHLEGWHKQGGPSDLTVPGSAVAMEISTFFRFVATPLAGRYGGGESGICRWLTHARKRIAADPRAKLDEMEREFVDNALSTAWRNAQRLGPDESKWPRAARARVTERRLGYYESLDGFGSLDPTCDLFCPALTCVDGQTIHSQAGQSYTQYVPLHDVDAAMTVMPPGHGERADDPMRDSTYRLWADGKLHPAPLSREAVEKIARRRHVLAE